MCMSLHEISLPLLAVMPIENDLGLKCLSLMCHPVHPPSGSFCDLARRQRPLFGKNLINSDDVLLNCRNSRDMMTFTAAR